MFNKCLLFIFSFSLPKRNQNIKNKIKYVPDCYLIRYLLLFSKLVYCNVIFYFCYNMNSFKNKNKFSNYSLYIFVNCFL